MPQIAGLVLLLLFGQFEDCCLVAVCPNLPVTAFTEDDDDFCIEVEEGEEDGNEVAATATLTADRAATASSSLQPVDACSNRRNSRSTLSFLYVFMSLQR